jgi:hypothetical protein
MFSCVEVIESVTGLAQIVEPVENVVTFELGYGQIAASGANLGTNCLGQPGGVEGAGVHHHLESAFCDRAQMRSDLVEKVLGEEVTEKLRVRGEPGGYPRPR